MAKIDWNKAREEYVANPELSYEDIAGKYIVTKKAVFEIAKRENWVGLRNQTTARLIQELPGKIAETAGEYTAKKFRQGAIAADRAIEVLSDPNLKIGGKVATEMLVAGHKLQTEALGLDNPKTQVLIQNQQNNVMMFTSIDEFMKEMNRRIEEEKG